MAAWTLWVADGGEVVDWVAVDGCWLPYEGSRESEGRCGRVKIVPPPLPCRAISIDKRAGVDVPDAETEGWRLREPVFVPVAAAARSADACETDPRGKPVVLPACT